MDQGPPRQNMDPYSSPDGMPPHLQTSSNGSPSEMYGAQGFSSIGPHGHMVTASDPDTAPADSIGPDGRTAAAAPPAVPAACLACRGKHLKCDGKNPCSRCQLASCECVYVASRRGYKGPRRNTAATATANPNKRHATESPPSAGGDTSYSQPPCPMLLGATIATPGAPPPSAFNPALVGYGETHPPAASPYVNAAHHPTTPLGPPQPPPFMAGGGGVPYPVGGGDNNLQLFHHHQQQQQQQRLQIQQPQFYGHHHNAATAEMTPPSYLSSVKGALSSMYPSPPPQQPVSVPDRCIEAFYRHFFPGHPSVLPRDALMKRARRPGGGGDLEHLLAAMRWAGSMYLDIENGEDIDSIVIEGNQDATETRGPTTTPGADTMGRSSGAGGLSTPTTTPTTSTPPTDHEFGKAKPSASPLEKITRASLYASAIRPLLYDSSIPRDGFLIQALVIVLITLDGMTEQGRARELLGLAESTAIQIRLYTRGYAAAHGEGDHVLEESWRRTWWDLFVVSGMIAGVHRQTNFLLFDIVSDVALPCEEHQYLSGNIPPRPMFLEDFDDQIFTDDDREFSSFAYRVAAIRNLGRMMRLPNNGLPSDENVDRIESQLSNWRMHLPASKRDALDKHCRIDEMMFQAHMIIHACSINLHQPLSQLDSSPARDVTACAPHRAVAPGAHFNIHTRHIVSAASAISRMVTYTSSTGPTGIIGSDSHDGNRNRNTNSSSMTMSSSITSHTHFFTCVLTLSSIVHLSRWALLHFLQGDEDEDLRQRIRLNIGALSELSGVWRAAGRAGQQVKGVAREIYGAKRLARNNPGFWDGWGEEEVLRAVAEDEGIIGEIEGILGNA